MFTATKIRILLFRKHEPFTRKQKVKELAPKPSNLLARIINSSLFLLKVSISNTHSALKTKQIV